jgi:hypothetical protein
MIGNSFLSEALDPSRTEALLTPTAYECFDLDVTDRCAGDAAREILRHVERHTERNGRYPV